jgi:hypothetical protein
MASSLETPVPGTRFSATARWACCSIVLLTAPLSSETYIVDRLDDANGPCTVGDCSIREAILAAEANPGFDTIVLAPGRHTLSIPPTGDGHPEDGGLEILDHDLEIVAPEGATVDAGGIDRVFRFLLSNSQLTNLRITEGAAPGVGGGVLGESSDLDLTNVWIDGNSAGLGGGLMILLGTVKLYDSAVTNNESFGSGGGAWLVGISQFNVGRLELHNSTISGNHAELLGGAVRKGGQGQLLLDYSTVYNNTNRPGDPTINGFLPGSLSTSDAIYSLVEGACSAGVDDHQCIFLADKSQEVAVPDLRLGPLAVNGGTTPTHALLSTSPALEIVPAAAACPAMDQRGASRPQDADADGQALCDAGAFELGPPPVVEIPTLSVLGLASLVLLLLAAAAATNRRMVNGPTSRKR